MDNIGWQEIAVRLLFAFILGSGTAVDRKWYRTKQYLQSNTLIALGAAMFSILASLTPENEFSSQLIIGISIVCFGVSFQKQADTSNANIDTIIRLWCAGALGSIVGFGFFVLAYIGLLIIIVTNLLFTASQTNFVPDIEKEFNANAESKDELEPTVESTPQEVYYQCSVNCLTADEAEVLALLVQLGKEQELMPIKISSKNVVDDSIAPRTEIQIDFVCDGKSSSLQLQQVLTSLKSQVKVNSATWFNLSSEPNSNKKKIILEKQDRT